MLIAFFITCSCKKDDFSPKKYEKSRYDSGGIHLYAKGGEINDVDKIDRFIDKIKSDFASFDLDISLDSNIIDYNNADFTFELIASDRACFTLGNGQVREYTLKREDGAIYFIQDSIAETTENIAYDEVWAKFKPHIVSTEPILLGQIIRYKPSIYAYEINGEIQFPILSFMGVYMPSRTNSGYCEEVHMRVQNSMSESFLNRITIGTYPSDSIVFRESRIVFSEK
ncbi:MAG TPA: hypothetical protein DIW31_06850 [Bacteroidales bacterium]|nr:hypothetical protein [Bacteroidales bacterium]